MIAECFTIVLVVLQTDRRQLASSVDAVSSERSQVVHLARF
jgi:hypothetical protein